MANDGDESKGNFWTTLPGVLTGVAAVLTALTGLWAGLHHTADPAATPPAIVEGPPQTTAATAQQPQTQGLPQSQGQPAPPPAATGDVTITARSGATSKVSLKSFHHNMTETSLALASGQTITFDHIRQLDFGSVDDDEHLVTVNITLTDGHTMSGDLATNYAFKGEGSLGPFTLFVQDVRRIVFPS